MTFKAGLTTVELLITLFVAAMFLSAGYALYNFTMNDSGDLRAEVYAARLADGYLDQFSVASGACVPQTPMNNMPVEAEGLHNTRVSVKVVCPNPATPNLGLVNVTVKYNSPEKTLVRSGYSLGDSS